MRKIIILAILLGLVATMLPAKASSATVKQRLAKLEAKLSCLQRVPASRFGGYAWMGPSSGVNDYDPASPGTNPVLNYGDVAAVDLVWSRAARDVPFWFLAVKNTNKCERRFGVLKNPFAGRSIPERPAAFRLARLQ